MTCEKVIGYIEAVDDQQIEVRMTERAGESSSAETRAEQVRVGSYVVIRQEDYDLLATVISQSTRPAGRNTEGQPGQSNRVMTVTAVGTICGEEFHRGVRLYPLIGQAVSPATDRHLAAIFTTWDQQFAGSAPGPENGQTGAAAQGRRLSLGRFVPNERYEVSLDGKLFCARHAAILGSSGSGKSCTVARVIQQIIAVPETQTVLFDLHGEYLPAFCGEDDKPLPNVAYISGDELVLPYWLLRYEEMEELFLDSSNHANIPSQQTFLKESLLRLRSESAEALGLTNVYTVDSPIYFSLEKLRRYANNLNNARFVLNSDRLAFRQAALRQLPPEEQDKFMVESEASFNLGNPEGEVAHPLFHGKLGGLVNLLDQKMNDHRYDFMLRPIAQATRSELFCDIFGHDESPADYSRGLEQLLALLSGHHAQRKNLVIIDLSQIPFETVDITVALLTRLLYEFNFWCSTAQRKPILLVYEEAHNYIPAERPQSFARRAVERVAKEGRKYGVGALVVSQRPLEVSETVLSQCNSFILMRMSNPADQAYVSKVVAEQFAGLVGTLARLRCGEAYAVGEAVPMPMRTQVYLTERPPDSADAGFFEPEAQLAARKNIAGAVDAWWRQKRPKRVPNSTRPEPRQEPVAAATTA